MSEMTKIKRNKPLFYIISLILILVSFIAISEALGWPFLKKPLQNFIEKKLDRTVRIDNPFKLRLLGGVKLKAGGIWISAPADFNVQNLADAKGVELKLRYKDLWNIKPGDPYVIKSIKAEQLDANFARHLDGNSTWQFKKNENDPIRPFPIINSLIINHGQAKVEDALAKANLTIKFSTNEGDNNANAQSKVAIHGDFRDRKLASELITYGFLPIASQTKKSDPVSSKGWLDYGKVHMDFNGSIDDLFGEQNIKGKIAVTGPSLGDLGDLLSITLPRTTPFKINGNIERNQEGWLIDIASAHIGQSDLYGNFKYDTRPEKALLKGTLKGKRFILADLAPAFGAAAKDGTQTKPRNKVFPDEPLNFATYNRMNADVTIDIAYVNLGKAFREPLAPFKANLILNKNKLSLAKLYARTAQGSIVGNIFIDAHQQKITNPQKDKNDPKLKPDWGIDLAVKDIDLKRWLQVSAARKQKAKRENKSEASEAYVIGLLNAHAKLEGKGNSTAELLRSLNGDVSLYIRNGEISHLVIEAAGLDIAQAVGLLIKGDQNLKMQCAVADFKSRNGVMNTNVALVDTSVTTILMSGNVNMGEERLNLRLTAEPKNFSPFTVRSPIDITGTFLNPKVTPEKGPIVTRIAGGVLLAIINPLAAILPFLDPGANTSDNPSCSATLGQIKQKIKSPSKSSELKPSQVTKK